MDLPGMGILSKMQHPQDNECHTICYDEINVLFDFDVLEEEDRLTQLSRPKCEVKLGKIHGPLLHLTKSIHLSATYAVLDSGFCVLKDLISLVKSSVFACALIKKMQVLACTAKAVPLT